MKVNMKKNKFNQLCVWPGVVLEDEDGKQLPIQEFVDFCKESFGVRVEFKCDIKTNPDLDNNGRIVEGTGGRNDVLFYIHDDDVSMFAVPRLHAGIRWWEDVVSYNDGSNLYPPEFIKNNPPQW